MQIEKRLVKVDKQHVAEVQHLLDCLGIPWIQAPGEAEAQCAEMTRQGIVYGTVTEDMDALTFGCPKLIRHLTMNEARKMPILEFDLEKVLTDFKVTMDQFIDICILCGCDYIQSIRGIGPKKAFEYITKYGDIENVLKNIDATKYKVPSNFWFEECRKLFKNPNVNKDIHEKNFEWKDFNEANVIQFLVSEKGFNVDRVKTGLKRLQDSKGKANQQRLDSFFKFRPSLPSTPRNNNNNASKTDDVSLSPTIQSPAKKTNIIGKKRKEIELSDEKEKNKKLIKI